MKKDPLEPFWRITAQEAKDFVDQRGATVVDCREPNEYVTGHIPGARLIPLGAMLDRAKELDPADEIVLVCAAGIRSAAAAEITMAFGRTKVYNLEGGMRAWTEQGYPIEK